MMIAHLWIKEKPRCRIIISLDGFSILQVHSDCDDTCFTRRSREFTLYAEASKNWCCSRLDLSNLMGDVLHHDRLAVGLRRQM